MFNNNYTTIPTDYVRAYYFDGNGNSTTGTNNATATNALWIKSDKLYQNQCLSWGASTSLTYTSVTYTNSYIWIYASGVWTFTKNSSKVTATALNGVSGERYAGLKFYNRTLTAEEERNLELEGQRQLGNGGSYPSLLSGLVGYWDFRGDATNLVDGVAGTVTGATLTTDRFGNSNSAYSFDGITYTILANAPDFFGTQPLSISSYIYINNLPSSGISMPISFTDGTVDSGLYDKSIYINSSGQLSFVVFDTTGRYAIYNGAIVGTWYHIVGTYDGVNLRVYVNGVQGTPTTATGTYNFTNPKIGFSGNGLGNRVRFNGKIGETMIFNRALSSDEVKLLYDLTSQDYIYPSKVYDLPNLRDGLVLDLDSNGKDLSGNGNNGTLVGPLEIIRQGRVKGLSYTSSGTYIDNIPNSQFKVTTYSFSCWIYNNGNTSTGGRIFSNLSIGSFNYGIDIHISETSGNHKIYVTHSIGGASQQFITTNTGVIDKKWTQITVTYNGNTQAIKIYFDGITQSLSSSTLGNPYTGYSDNYRIGQTISLYPDTYVNGKIINPKFYNRALSEKEVQQLYYSQKANFIY